MSAFIVKTDTMNRCIAAILSVDADNRLADIAPELHAMVGEPNRLGAALFALNKEAVSQRYPDDDEYARIPVKFVYKDPDLANKIVGFKALDCLHYQCSEGDVPETALYKELERIQGDIAGRIVRRLPTYDTAPWN